MANIPKGKKTPPAEPKKGLLGKLRPIELIAIGIFVLAFLLWGVSKCGGDALPPTPTNAVDSTGRTTVTTPAGSTATQPNLANTSIAVMRPLYVILDSLKLREDHKLDARVMRVLLFGQEVYDMGKRTDFEQTVKVSPSEKRTAPWVQVRTAEGQIGWVFGAGVEFYRKSKPGENPTVDLPGAVSTTATQPNTTTPAAVTATTPATTTATTPPNRGR